VKLAVAFLIQGTAQVNGIRLGSFALISHETLVLRMPHFDTSDPFAATLHPLLNRLSLGLWLCEAIHKLTLNGWFYLLLLPAKV
jgi:hypothetical protein